MLLCLQAKAASDARLARDIQEAEDRAEANAAEEARLRQEELDSINRCVILHDSLSHGSLPAHDSSSLHGSCPHDSSLPVIFHHWPLPQALMTQPPSFKSYLYVLKPSQSVGSQVHHPLQQAVECTFGASCYAMV